MITWFFPEASTSIPSGPVVSPGWSTRRSGSAPRPGPARGSQPDVSSTFWKPSVHALEHVRGEGCARAVGRVVALSSRTLDHFRQHAVLYLDLHRGCSRSRSDPLGPTSRCSPATSPPPPWMARSSCDSPTSFSVPSRRRAARYPDVDRTSPPTPLARACRFGHHAARVERSPPRSAWDAGISSWPT